MGEKDTAMDVVAYHSQIAREFHASYTNDPNRLERLQVWKTFIARHAGGSRFVYDMGCGSGVLACELAQAGKTVVGIDGSEIMLAIARKSAREKGLQSIRFEQHRLPLENVTDFRQADLVISSSCIEYIEPLVDVLKCFRDLVVPNGIVMVSMSNRDSLDRKLVRFVYRVTGRPRYQAHLRHFMTEASMRAALHEANLTFIEFAYFSGRDRRNRILSWFFSPRLSNNLMIVAARRDA
jgi:2-polyprenyl-3-methyl-5-hydroxy-6-metoxy-1,4-benzoquinol methylase